MTQRSRLIVAGDALRSAIGRAKAARPHECGGLLIGFRHRSDVHVEQTVLVPADHASRTRLVLSERTREDVLAQVFEDLRDDSPLGYVGTWHSHLGSTGPSFIDRCTLRLEGARASDLVAMLVIEESGDSWEPVAVVARNVRLENAAVEVVE